MSFCPKCGKEVSDEFKVCPYCGSTLGAPNASSAPVTPATPEANPFQQVQQISPKFPPTPAYQPKKSKKKIIIIIAAAVAVLLLLIIIISAGGKDDTDTGYDYDNDTATTSSYASGSATTAATTAATSGGKNGVIASDRIVEPVSEDGTGSILTGDDYYLIAFGKKYVIGEATLQDFLDDGWYLDPEDSFDDPTMDVDSYTYVPCGNLIKGDSIIYGPRFVNFSKTETRPLSECKLLSFTINFTGYSTLQDMDIPASNIEDLVLPLGVTKDYCMADLIDSAKQVGLGHYEQDYDRYYSCNTTNNYDDPDESYSIQGEFDHDAHDHQHYL